MSSDVTAPATCAPPPEHADKEWHWLRFQTNKAQPERWSPKERRWCWGAIQHSPQIVALMGYRYVGPAIPPTEGEG